MITVTEIRKTCFACPAQWEGTTDDGRFIYVRYRWGNMTVRVGPDLDSAVRGVLVFDWQDEDGYDGFMDYEQLKKLTSGIFNLPEMETECP